ncbi:MAG: HEAT repeat domain-containing protein [Candidatus Eremiobacterota bacterium]
MKYSIILIIILISIISLNFIGCNRKTNDTPVSGATPPAENPLINKETSFQIPSAKKLRSDLKVKADEKINIIKTSKDDGEKKAALNELKTLCKENPSDFSLFSYLIENTDGNISKTGMEALEKCYAGKMSEEEKAEEFEILSCAVKHPIDYIRCRAIVTMSYLSDNDERKEKQKTILRDSLKDKSCHVRITAIERIGQTGDKEMTDKLKEIMNGNDEPQVIAASMRTLERFNVNITEKLIEFLGKKDPHVKACAVEILARKKNKDVIPELIKMLDDKTGTVIASKYDNEITIIYSGTKQTLREMAIMALEAITGEKFGNNKDIDGTVAKWKEWYKKNK